VNNNPREQQVRVSALAEGDEAMALRWREER
jgi:hypothetical protein